MSLISLDFLVVGGNSSQVPLLRDTDSGGNSGKEKPGCEAETWQMTVQQQELVM